MHKTMLSAGALALASAILSAPAVAATAIVTADVERTRVTSGATFGGCMAKLSVDLYSELTTCKSHWVSFGCSGEVTDPLPAFRMLDQGQLALAAGKKVKVWFTDTTLYNGYCLATRIDVIQ